MSSITRLHLIQGLTNRRAAGAPTEQIRPATLDTGQLPLSLSYLIFYDSKHPSQLLQLDIYAETRTACTCVHRVVRHSMHCDAGK